MALNAYQVDASQLNLRAENDERRRGNERNLGLTLLRLRTRGLSRNSGGDQKNEPVPAPGRTGRAR